jgi:hypothetical protein
MKCFQNNIEKIQFLRLNYKYQPFKLFREIIALYSENHTKPTNMRTLCGQNTAVLDAKDVVYVFRIVHK